MIRTVLLALLLAACSPATSGGHVDAAKTAAVQANISGSCADGTLDFCDQMTKAANGGPDVAVSADGPLLVVSVYPGADASHVCSALASMHFDANGVDLGYSSVSVVSGGHEVASCRIP